jgi:hypothetical protein
MTVMKPATAHTWPAIAALGFAIFAYATLFGPVPASCAPPARRYRRQGR